MGTWHRPGEVYDPKKVHDKIKYSKDDDERIDDWVAGTFILPLFPLRLR